MKKKIGIVCVILSILLVLALLVPGFRTTAAENKTGETNMVTVTFSSYDGSLSWDCEYSDDYFFLPSDEFHLSLARLSLGLAYAAFRDSYNEDQDDNLIAFFEDIGFEDFDTHLYETESTSDSICYGIGRKTIGDTTVIAIGVNGGSYGKEWASNVTVGDSVLSEGFANAAEQVEEGLKDYLEEYPAEGDLKLWVSGYSRGAAVANVVAAQCTDSGMFKDVYGYSVATPRTTREPGDYKNIYNMVGKDDPVPKIPLADWGYQRFGVDKLFVSLKTDTGSAETVKKTAELYEELIGREMVLNEELYYEIRVILDYILYVFPDSESYTALLQPLLRDVITGSDDTENALEVLMNALSGFSAESEEQEAELKELVDYIETLLNYYVYQGATEKMPPILWDQHFGIKNLYCEHYPFKYLAALYASDDPEELFSDKTGYVRLVIYGNVDAEIYDGDKLLKTVLADGTELVDGGDANFTYPLVKIAKNQKVISLTVDRNYTVKVTSRSSLPQAIAYTGNLYSGETVRAKTDPIYFNTLGNGKTIQITTSGDGRVIDPGKSEYMSRSSVLGDKYSPTVAVSLEYNKVAHLTISGLVTFLVYFLAFFLVQLIASIVLAIIRKKKKKERNIPFTSVWHGVNVLLFVFCEVSMWYFVSAYPILKLIPMILALIVLLVFAWKLYRLNKSRKMLKRFLIYAAALVVFGLLNGFFAGDCTVVKAIILTLIYIAFFAAALLLFRRGEDAEEPYSGEPTVNESA